MDENTEIRKLLETVKRRRLGNLVLEGAAVALSIAMAGAILLLLVGTQILNWYWLLVLFGAAGAVGLYRSWKRFPSSYRLLQQVDQRLHLHDMLSTAYYFNRSGHDGGEVPAEERTGRNGSAPASRASMRAAQRSEAEKLARSVDPRAAAPWKAPTSIYLAVATVAAAGALFALRYGATRSLDLRPPVTAALPGFFRPTPAMAQAREDAPLPSRESSSEAPPQSQAGNRHSREMPAELTAMEAPASPVDGSTVRRGENPWSRPREESNRSTQPGAHTAAAEQSPQPPLASAVTEASAKPPRPRQDSLIRKMEDAFAKLISSLKIKTRAASGRRLAPASARSRRASTRNRRRPRPRSPGSSGNQATSDRNSQGAQADPQGRRPASPAVRSRTEASGRTGQKPSPGGRGTADGNKDLDFARQIEAMGKIAEILGKRARNIKGEVMVETATGYQRLRTAYSDTAATHHATSVEIHRDEVPLALRPYIRRYFEEVRKRDAAPVKRHPLN